MKLRLIIALLSTGFIAASTLSAQTADSLVAEGRLAIENQELLTAQEKLQAALAINENHPDANALLALVRIANLADREATQNALAPFGFSSGSVDGESTLIETGESFPVSAGFGKWAHYRNAAADSSDALLSGSPPPDFSSQLSTTIQGPGTLKFRWANYASSWGDHRLALLQDGSQIATLANDSDWTDAEHSVPEGIHTYTWSFANFGYWTDTNAYGGLDAVRFYTGENETPPADDGSQTGLSLANGLDNNDLAWTTLGTSAFDPNHSLSETKDYIANTLLSEIDKAARNLITASSDPNYTIELTAAETGGSSATADSGDLKLIAANLQLLRSLLLSLTAYNWEAKLGVLHEIDNSIYLDPQSILSAFPQLFTLQNTTLVEDAKDAFLASESLYQSASTLIRNRTTTAPRLFTLEPEEQADEADFRERFSQLAASIVSPQQIDGDTVDLSPLFADGFKLRENLPQFIRGNIVEDTFPDPTFQGILPDYSSERLRANLRGKSALRPIPLSDTLKAIQIDEQNAPVYETAELFLSTLSSNGSLVGLSKYDAGKYNGFTFDHATQSLTAITAPSGTRPIELDPFNNRTYLSRDGNFAFFSSYDPELITPYAGNGAANTIIPDDGFLPLPFLENPGTSFFFSTTAATPNSGKYPAQLILDLDLPWPVEQSTLLRFNLTNPASKRQTITVFIPEGQDQAYLRRELPNLSDPTEWEGTWEFAPSFSDNQNLWGAYVNQLTLLLDAPPAQLFRKNLTTGDIDLVSQNANGEISERSVSTTEHLSSSDGRYVTFTSQSNTLAPGINNPDHRHLVFLKDMQTGATSSISAANEDPVTSTSRDSSISADGQSIAFRSNASHVAADDNTRYDIYSYNIAAQSYTLLSSAQNGTVSLDTENPIHSNPLLSADGNATIFQSNGASIALGTPTENRFDQTHIYLKTPNDSALNAIDVDTNGDLVQSPATYSTADLSADGRFIVFTSTKPGLAQDFDQPSDQPNAYLRDTQTQNTLNLTNNQNQSAPLVGISDDASLIAYSQEGELSLYDRQNQKTTRFAFEYQPSGYVSFEKSSYYISDSASFASVPVIWNYTDDEPDSIEVDLVTYRGNISFEAPSIDTTRTLTLTKTNPRTEIKIPLFQGFIQGYIGFAGVYIDAVRGSEIGPMDDSLIALFPSQTKNAFHAYLSQFLPDGAEPFAYSPLVDLDEDGIVNYMEMLLGGNPLQNDASSLFQIIENLDTGTFQLKLQVNTNLHDAIYLEMSGDLNQPWDSISISELSSSNGVVVTESQDGILSLEIDASYLPVTNAQFFRLRIDR